MYLELLEKWGNYITPNFYISEEYFKKAKLEEAMHNEWVYVVDGDWVCFPAVSSENPEIRFRGEKVWSDFYFPLKGVSGYKPQFLDYEYIYDPKRFLNMEGGVWEVFRKNSRKFPKRYDKGEYLKLKSSGSFLGLDQLLVNWLEGKEGKEIFDDEVMLEYLRNGENRKILYVNGEIVGINIWDENYKYINFRYSFCKKLDFLNEYLRLLFYTDEEILSKNKMVNDGGICNNPDLKKFKEKMHPYSVREVNSWIRQPSLIKIWE